jgi:hypothetical protein
MYRKQADKLIVRDVRKRLAAMEAPDWRQAAIGCAWEHPDWFQHRGLLEVEDLLRGECVEPVTAESKLRFVGNEQSVNGPDD